MISRFLLSVFIGTFSMAALAGCPQDAPEGEEVYIGNSGDSTGDSELAIDTAVTEDEPEPIYWKVEGLKENEPLQFSSGVSNTFTLKFDFAEGCHYNDETPLELRVTAPEGITVDPTELAYDKPEGIPEEFVFTVSGVKDGGSGVIDLDLVAFFCSDEGFCMRKMDTVSLTFAAGDADGEPANYKVSYLLDPDL